MADHMATQRLYFPASLAAEYGHVTKFWLLGCGLGIRGGKLVRKVGDWQTYFKGVVTEAFLQKFRKY